MASLHSAERVFTQLDYVRIMRLISPSSPSPRASPDVAREVEALLQEGDVVESPSVPPQVVTMYGQLRVRESGKPLRTLVLCYPQDAEPAAGFVSVLSPVGRALLGLRVGQVARWLSPDGAEHAATIVELLFQPEGSGDYTT